MCSGREGKGGEATGGEGIITSPAIPGSASAPLLARGALATPPLLCQIQNTSLQTVSVGKSTLRRARLSSQRGDGPSRLAQAVKPRSGCSAAAVNCRRSNVVVAGGRPATSTASAQQNSSSLHSSWKVVKCDSNSIKLRLTKAMPYPH